MRNKKLEKLYIYNDGYGQLCNKLLFLANVYASSQEHNFTVYYYKFPLKSGFRCINRLPENFKIINHSVVYLLLKMAVKFHSGRMGFLFLNSEEKECKAILKYKVSLWWGWPYFDIHAVKKYEQEVRRFLAFDENIEVRADNIISRNKNSMLIAVHIRRSDYKEYANGKYYYNDMVYVAVLYRCIEIFGSNISFLFFSDENINMRFYKQRNFNCIKSEGNAVLDLALMSRCDYIVGPPSTFSGWASFYGNVPKYEIRNPTYQFEKKDFKVWLCERFIRR